jgi:uncharacterized phage infection (PIP) family protein YhgE
MQKIKHFFSKIYKSLSVISNLKKEITINLMKMMNGKENFNLDILENSTKWLVLG